MSYINKIEVALPLHKHKQTDIGEYMARFFGFGFMLKPMFENSKIEHRYSVLPDFTPTNEYEPFYSKGHKPPTVEERLKIYSQEAPELCRIAFEKLEVDSKEITHLLTVSCTGMSAPGLEIILMNKLGFADDIYRTSINFMGCYAAIHALKHADLICKTDPEAKVLIVSVELCTLHYQYKMQYSNMASSILFGDGAAAVLVSNHPEGLKINAFKSGICWGGLDDMQWNISADGFKMELSPDIPTHIKESIETFTQDFFKKNNVTKTEIDYWAIHPGGKAVLEAVEESLDLAPEKLSESYTVLNDFGNMSSATVLFVLKEIMQKTEKNKRIFSCGFGPGITIESMLLST